MTAHHRKARRDPDRNLFAKGQAFGIAHGEGRVWPQGSLQRAKTMLPGYIHQGWPKCHIVVFESPPFNEVMGRYDHPGTWKRWTRKAKSR